MAHPNLWYPYTQAKTAPDPTKVIAAQGAWLELENGQRILDCISSWWVNLYGHAHPHIAEAIYTQARTLEQVIFSGFTHQPAETLAERLTALLPEPLTRVFYSDNGSTAVEVALKMAYQYWLNQKQQRRTFIAFEGAYHGDTFGAMSVCARSTYSDAFAPMLFEVEFLPFPDTFLGDAEVEVKEAAALAILQEKLQQNPDRYAGVIVEPLVQGAYGMRMGRPQFLQQVQQCLREWGVLLIFDEVMTGFGRLGTKFACDRVGICPDIICLSKGITGGFLPFSATVCTEAIYEAFYSEDLSKTLYHGHSYAGNPLGCAAAIAGLDLLPQYEPKFAALERKHLEHLQTLKDHPQVERLRVTGTIAAMDITTVPEGYLNSVSVQVRQLAIEHNLLLRPLGNVLYLLPPYCITDGELAFIYDGIQAILNKLA